MHDFSNVMEEKEEKEAGEVKVVKEERREG